MNSSSDLYASDEAGINIFDTWTCLPCVSPLLLLIVGLNIFLTTLWPLLYAWWKTPWLINLSMPASPHMIIVYPVLFYSQPNGMIWSCVKYTSGNSLLMHSGRVTHIFVRKITIIGWNNGRSTGRRRAIFLTNAGNVVSWTIRNKIHWNLNRNLYIFIHWMLLKMPSASWWPFCLCLVCCRVPITPLICSNAMFLGVTRK